MYKIVHRMNDSLVGIALLTPPTECDIVLIMETKLCTNCSRPVPLYAYDMHLEVCRSSYIKPFDKSGKQRETIISREAKRHDRQCQVCHKPCWPNYFFCRSCQGSMKDRNWDTWGDAV